MTKRIPSPEEKQIPTTAINLFLDSKFKAHLDSAAQNVLIPEFQPFHNNAKHKLAQELNVVDVDDAMKHLLEFHKQVMTKIDHAAMPELQVRLSSPKLHRFYSLMYHLIDQPEAPFEEYRRVIEKSFTALQLPPPLTMEELKPYMQEIIKTVSPAIIQERQR